MKLPLDAWRSRGQGLSIALMLLLASCSGSGDSGPAATATAAPTGAATLPPAAASQPPPEYAAMYASLSQNLDAWQQKLAGVAAAGPAPVFGAHVLAANSNRGAALLEAGTLGVVDLSLDRLKQLGVQGATITISFPLLNPDQPRSADYLAFYETVARHVRDRGLVLSIEQHVIFSGTQFSSVQFDFSKLTFEQFVALDRQMTETLLIRLQPDYLTVLSEPDTLVRLTGYRQALGPQAAAAMVERIVGGLPKARTKVGAGAGAWLPDAPDYAAAFARTSLDYVDLHIYGVTPQTFDLAQGVVNAAHAAGKPVVLDEAWLYKLNASEGLGGGGIGFDLTTEIIRRDAFSFWAPLDSRFLALIAQFARANGIVYVAPFWSTYFWGYADYGPDTSKLPYSGLAQLANMGATEALRNGTFTPTGNAYGAAIRGR